MARAWETLFAGMDRWHQTKLFIEHGTSIGNDALHILFGLVFWLFFAAVTRRPLSRWLPFLAVLAVIAINEVVDLKLETWPDPGHQYGEGFKDFVLTLVVPFALMLLIRWYPRLFTGGRGARR